jgi:predicted negative regulator of RcsB-dependent stress response
MATASNRVTRKELRQPDWFQRTTNHGLILLQHHQGKFIAAAVVLLLIVLGIAGWQIYKARQDDQAAQEFSRAMRLYQEQKFNEAIPAFDKVAGFRWSRYAALAHLFQANIYLTQNQLDKAIPAAQRFIAATAPDSMYRQIGLVALATAEERKNQCPQAAQHYAEAARINSALKERATLGKARCAAQNGDTKTALEAYREYLKENPNSPVSMQVAELEAKAGLATGSKK